MKGLAALAVLALSAAAICAQTPAAQRTVLYAAVGADLTRYDLDRTSGALIERTSVTLPENVQEAWFYPPSPAPRQQYLYVAWSNGGLAAGSVALKGDHHGISAFHIDPGSGNLVLRGKPVTVPWRPIFLTTDVGGTRLLTAYNDPSGLTVHRIIDGTIGDRLPLQMPSDPPLDFGIYGHQVRVDPSNKTVILMTRGNGPTATKPEDPGAIKLFSYADGMLKNRLSIAPAGGFGYQVRHLDFHPSGKWAFVTLERQNQLHVYARMPYGTLGSTPLFVKDTVAEPGKAGSGQVVASIHVHPSGRFVYTANRAAGTVEFEGRRVFAGGENTIAVFSINQSTGEPTLIQSADTHGFTPRTFTLDSSGRFLAVANQSPLSVHHQNGVSVVPASLALFRIGDDGKLEFTRKYDVDTSGGKNLFWTGFASLP